MPQDQDLSLEDSTSPSDLNLDTKTTELLHRPDPELEVFVSM